MSFNINYESSKSKNDINWKEWKAILIFVHPVKVERTLIDFSIFKLYKLETRLETVTKFPSCSGKLIMDNLHSIGSRIYLLFHLNCLLQFPLSFHRNRFVIFLNSFGYPNIGDFVSLDHCRNPNNADCFVFPFEARKPLYMSQRYKTCSLKCGRISDKWSELF